MKQSKFLVVFLLGIFLTMNIGFAAKKSGNGANLVTSSGDETVLTFTVGSYELKDVTTPKGIASILVAPGTGKMLEKGAPALLKLTSSLIIPDEGKMNVEVMESNFTEIKNVEIAPSKGNLLRNVDPDKVPYEYSAVYQTNDFYPANLVELGKPYIARDFRGQTVVVNPFRYNPVTKTLRVYSDIKVKVTKGQGKGENEMKRGSARHAINPDFKRIYSTQFINYLSATRYTQLPDSFGNMLIVCYSGFMSDMADFVSWKQSIGYTVDLVDYATIGSATALKTYVANYYNTNGLSYLLLVGDHAQVPTSSTSAGDSDNNYGYIVGSDHYLDILVGRFSAESSAHVQTQVERTVEYERDLYSSDTFFRNAIGMGSSEGPGHDGEYDYQHINNILMDLYGIGYTTLPCHESGGSPALMTSYINAGAGTIFYCGHGALTQWYTSTWQYTSTNVDALTNENILPFIVSVACVVGDFAGNTCYCETWLRATNNGEPTGAVAHAGSTINQSWIPPMDGEDEMADLLVSGNVRTFSGMFVNGLFKMIDMNGGDGEDMADTWVCFGDPSVQMRTPIAPDGPGSGNQSPRGDFTYTDNLLQVTFTDTSYDNDGTIVSWSWNFGDGTTSTLQNPVHTYAASGNYNVTITVTDDMGATGYKSKNLLISNSSDPEMYVYNISMNVTKSGRYYTGIANITIYDKDGNVVPNATVSATWSGAVSGSTTAVTAADGKATFTSSRVKVAGPFTITVTNATHATFTYNAALNNETSDSVTY